jgi:hypothetical protein
MVEVPMTDEQFAKAQVKLRGHGIELPGKSGTMSRQGVTAKYEHADGKLRIEVTDKPFLLPQSLIEGQMKSFLEKELGNL